MEKKDDSTKIDLGDLLKEYQESDPSTLQNYLAEIWVDLARRSKDPIKGIEKLTFRNYFELPGIIADRLFAVFDRDCNGFLDHGEFIYSMKILFAQGETFQTLAKFIFRFYDFDKNGKIDREDVRVVLSYVPLNKKSDQKSKIKSSITEDFQDRVESQSQLVDILNTAFGDKKELNLNDYTQVIENVNSDIFILILQFLLESKPFSKDTIHIFALNEKLNAAFLELDDDNVAELSKFFFMTYQRTVDNKSTLSLKAAKLLPFHQELIEKKGIGMLHRCLFTTEKKAKKKGEEE